MCLATSLQQHNIPFLALYSNHSLMANILKSSENFHLYLQQGSVLCLQLRMKMGLCSLCDNVYFIYLLSKNITITGICFLYILAEIQYYFCKGRVMTFDMKVGSWCFNIICNILSAQSRNSFYLVIKMTLQFSKLYGQFTQLLLYFLLSIVL